MSAMIAAENINAARAALIDGLTAARAGYLDRLNAGGVPVVKSVQSGWVQPNTAGTAGTASTEDAISKDVAISAVVIAKCMVFVAGTGYTAGSPMAFDNNGNFEYMATGRLTSTTNLRISSWGGAYNGGRWQVIEFW